MKADKVMHHGYEPGDIVRRRKSEAGIAGDLGLFIGFKKSGNYEYAEVMWFEHKAPNGGPISTVQKRLLEVVK